MAPPPPFLYSAFNIGSNVCGLPAVVLVLAATGGYEFEGVVGLFTFIASFMYHACQATPAQPRFQDHSGVWRSPEPAWGLGESEWHRLDNAGAITSLMLLAHHLADLPRRRFRAVGYLCLLANVCVQFHPAWAYDIRFTAVPIAASFGLCVARHVLRLIAGRGRRGGPASSSSSSSSWLRRLFPGAWWRVVAGCASFAAAGYCFAVGLNDNMGPTQFVWHGGWHVFGGLGMWHLWQALPLDGSSSSSSSSTHLSSGDGGGGGGGGGAAMGRRSGRIHSKSKPHSSSTTTSDVRWFGSIMPACGYGALVLCYAISVRFDWDAATHTHCRARGMPHEVFTSTSACIGFWPQRGVWQLLIVGALVPLQLATACFAYAQFSRAPRFAGRNALLLGVHLVELAALATLSLLTSSDMWLAHVAATAVWIVCSPLHCLLYVRLYRDAVVARSGGLGFGFGVGTSTNVLATSSHSYGAASGASTARTMVLTVAAAVQSPGGMGWSAQREASAYRYRVNVLCLHLVATVGTLVLWALHNTICLPYLYSIFGLFELAQIVANIAFNQECMFPPFQVSFDPLACLPGGGSGSGSAAAAGGDGGAGWEAV